MIVDTLNGKKILLGVTGGIAAYKSTLIVRNLVSRGAEVKVVMTPSALEFITPLTLSTLSQNNVIVRTFPASQQQGVELKTWHIDLAEWADLMLIAPATINTVAKIVYGFADNALTTVASALRCPLVIAPAADSDMYNNTANIDNIKTLRRRGAFIVDAEKGFLASGLEGTGRMADITKIIDAVEIVASGYRKDLTGRKVLVTAGPTYEDIDPVRYLGNRSSGKMGYAIAKAAYLRGADVTLVSGHSAEIAYQDIKKIDVRSAAEMKQAVDKELAENDTLIMSAAVADYKPSKTYDKKVKKEEKLKSIELTETEDIIGSIDSSDKFIVGFALETDKAIENAKKKLSKKNLDVIVLNSMSDPQAGFEKDTNQVTIMSKDGSSESLDPLTKFQTANKILNYILKK
jgi:phosphopantothenoylcysteine decarboxylase/phosphopantothenate--cysteine ligase